VHRSTPRLMNTLWENHVPNVEIPSLRHKRSHELDELHISISRFG
jgi:hypothetical protein